MKPFSAIRQRSLQAVFQICAAFIAFSVVVSSSVSFQSNVNSQQLGGDNLSVQPHFSFSEQLPTNQNERRSLRSSSNAKSKKKSGGLLNPFLKPLKSSRSSPSNSWLSFVEKDPDEQDGEVPSDSAVDEKPDDAPSEADVAINDENKEEQESEHNGTDEAGDEPDASDSETQNTSSDKEKDLTTEETKNDHDAAEGDDEATEEAPKKKKQSDVSEKEATPVSLLETVKKTQVEFMTVDDPDQLQEWAKNVLTPKTEPEPEEKTQPVIEEPPPTNSDSKKDKGNKEKNAQKDKDSDKNKSSDSPEKVSEKLEEKAEEVAPENEQPETEVASGDAANQEDTDVELDEVAPEKDQPETEVASGDAANQEDADVELALEGISVSDLESLVDDFLNQENPDEKIDDASSNDSGSTKELMDLEKKENHEEKESGDSDKHKESSSSTIAFKPKNKCQLVNGLIKCTPIEESQESLAMRFASLAERFGQENKDSDERFAFLVEQVQRNKDLFLFLEQHGENLEVARNRARIAELDKRLNAYNSNQSAQMQMDAFPSQDVANDESFAEQIGASNMTNAEEIQANPEAVPSQGRPFHSDAVSKEPDSASTQSVTNAEDIQAEPGAVPSQGRPFHSDANAKEPESGPRQIVSNADDSQAEPGAVPSEGRPFHSDATPTEPDAPDTGSPNIVSDDEMKKSQSPDNNDGQEVNEEDNQALSNTQSTDAKNEATLEDLQTKKESASIDERKEEMREDNQQSIHSQSTDNVRNSTLEDDQSEAKSQSSDGIKDETLGDDQSEVKSQSTDSIIVETETKTDGQSEAKSQSSDDKSDETLSEANSQITEEGKEAIQEDAQNQSTDDGTELTPDDNQHTAKSQSADEGNKMIREDAERVSEFVAEGKEEIQDHVQSEAKSQSSDDQKQEPTLEDETVHIADAEVSFSVDFVSPEVEQEAAVQIPPDVSSLPKVTDDEAVELPKGLFPLLDPAGPAPRVPDADATDEERQELPQGWQTVVDPISHEIFYWNTLTDEVTWYRPEPVQHPQPQTTQSEEDQEEGNSLLVRIPVSQQHNAAFSTDASKNDKETDHSLSLPVHADFPEIDVGDLNTQNHQKIVLEDITAADPSVWGLRASQPKVPDDPALPIPDETFADIKETAPIKRSFFAGIKHWLATMLGLAKDTDATAPSIFVSDSQRFPKESVGDASLLRQEALMQKGAFLQTLFQVFSLLLVGAFVMMVFSLFSNGKGKVYVCLCTGKQPHEETGDEVTSNNSSDEDEDDFKFKLSEILRAQTYGTV